MKCNLPPEGWHCSRPRGHEGPCAALPIDVDFEKHSPAKELLGQFVDLSVKIRAKPRSFSIENEAFCLFCGDTAKVPPLVRHKDGCIVAQAQAFLRR